MRKLAPALAVLLALAGCSSASTGTTGGTDSPGGDPTSSSAMKVTYKVTTTGKVNVVYGSTSGTSSKEVSKDWSTTQDLKDFDGATLIVTNADFMKSVKLSCEILINGESKSKNTSSGKSASASCTASTVG